MAFPLSRTMRTACALNSFVNARRFRLAMTHSSRTFVRSEVSTKSGQVQQYHEMTEELTRAKDDVELMRRLAETIQEKLDAECARNEVLTNELDAVRRRAE